MYNDTAIALQPLNALAVLKPEKDSLADIYQNISLK